MPGGRRDSAVRARFQAGPGVAGARLRFRGRQPRDAAADR